jgi:dolichyl-diphosphooligosaccharide--protein glycosyltransferase
MQQDKPSISSTILNKWTIVILLAFITGLAFFLRTYYALPAAIQNASNGWFSVSGGADSYYHQHVIEYILSTHHQLLTDIFLNYPVGLIDPRPPFFDWIVAVLAYVISPFFGFNVTLLAASYSLTLITSIFGAFLSIPMYLIGKEAFNKKVGIISAFLIAISAANMSRSVAGWGGYDTVILFFGLLTWYFFLKALKSVKKDVWIDDWFKLSSIKTGSKKFFSENHNAIIYAALSGISMGTIAMTWTGFSYIEVIILVFLIIQLFINRFRNTSSFHLLIIALVFGLFAYLPSLPWYWVENVISPWYNVPFYLLVFTIFVALFMELTSRYPWTFVYPAAIVGIIIIYLVGWRIDSSLMNFIVSGQGYFIKNKLYSTIAEAQPPSLAQLILSVGDGVFFLFVGGFLYIIYKARKLLYDYYIFIIIFSAVSVYMAFAASRFIINGSPGFIIPSAFALDIIITRFNFGQIQKDFKNMSHLGFAGFKKSVKWSKVAVVVLIAVLVIFPNVWSAVDAAIPLNNDAKFDKQIYDAMPAIIRPPNYTEPWYLGAYGFYLPPATDPLTRALTWLSEQDTNLSPQDRPALLSWWDYGFQTIAQGEHPVVADNFQDGYQVAGQVLLAQNESENIALLIARVLDGNQEVAINDKLSTTFTPQINQILIEYLGTNELQKIEDYYNYSTNQKYVSTILSNPDIYGVFESSISSQNIKYIMIAGDLASEYPESDLVNLYSALEAATGSYISYFLIDSNMFPFSGNDTGTFYAPATLTDREIYSINGNNIPFTYYNLTAINVTGATFPLNDIPANAEIVGYNISYTPAFYNTTLYRLFLGYYGSEVGASPGFPGLTSKLAYYPPMQAWNMTHFELVYKTAFWNPYKNYQNHTKAWQPVSIQQAYYYQQKGIGTADLEPPANETLVNDVVIDEYYPGAIISGKVTLPNGTPLSNIMVTLYDQYSIPHGYIYTNSQGYYTLDAVAGNDSLKFTTDGGMDGLLLDDKTSLASINLNISQDQANRIPTSVNASTGLPDYYITKNLIVRPGNVDGVVTYNVTNEQKNVSYAVVHYYNSTYGLCYNATTSSSGYYSITYMIPHVYQVSVTINNNTYNISKTETVSAGNNVTDDILLLQDTLKGHIINTNTPSLSYPIQITNIYNVTKTVYSSANGSYTAILSPGNYTVSINLLYFKSDSYFVSFDTWNKTKYLNITVSKAYKVSGIVSGSQVIPYNAFISFADTALSQNTKMVYTNAFGQYTTYLSQGYYSVYAQYFYNNVHYSCIEIISINGNTTLNISLSKAYQLSGYTLLNNSNLPDTSLSIFNGNNFININSNNTGCYSIYLPSGKYNIGAVGSSNNTPYSYYFTLTHINNDFINISLEPTSTYNGTVYSSVTSLKIYNGTVIMSGLSGPTYATHIGDNHQFSVYPQSNFTVSVTSINYAQNYVKYSGQNIFVYMVPANVTLQGNISYVNNVTYSGPLTINFNNGKNTYSMTTTDKHYSILLAPGKYNISFYAANLLPQSTTKSINVYAGNSTNTLNLNVEMYANVSVTPTLVYSLWFGLGGNIVGTGATTNLIIGSYTYYSYSDYYATINNITITQNSTYYVQPAKAYNVTVNIIGPTIELPLSVSTSSTKFIKPVNGSTSLELPVGVYNLSISYIYRQQGYYYSYAGYNLTKVTGNESVNILLSKSMKTGTLQGKAYLSSTAVPFADINFISLANPQILYNYYTAPNGTYLATLPYGSYIVSVNYLYDNVYYASLSNLNISSQSSVSDLFLSKAYYVTGIETVNGTIINIPINVTLKNTILSVSPVNGIYSLILPEGSYTFKGTIVRTEYNMPITYSLNQTVLINKNSDINLRYIRNNITNIKISAVTPVQTLSIDQNITYLVKVSNSGNTPQKINLEALDSNWNSKFSLNNFNIVPNSVTLLNITLKVPQSASHGLNNVSFMASYSGNYTDFSIPVNVSAYYNTTIKFDAKNTTMYTNNLEIPVIIYNNGNTLEYYNISLLNKAELSDQGWNSTLYYNNVSVTRSLKINAQSSITLILKNVPSSATVTQNITFYVSASDSVKAYTASYSPVLPHMKTGSLTITNLNYTSIPAAFNYNLLLILIIIAAAAFISLIIFFRVRK